MTDRPACPVPGCPRTRNRNHMMCRECWSRVTRPTQSAVYKAWRAYNRASLGGNETAYREAHEIYFAIRERAIREAEAAYHRRADLDAQGG